MDEEPILRMLKPPHAMQLFRQCELGNVKNTTRYKSSFLGRLIASDDFYYDQVYAYTQFGKIVTQEDKFFMGSARDVFNIHHKPVRCGEKLYSIRKYLMKTKLNESKMLSFKAPLSKCVLTPRDVYRPLLLIVTDDNHLLHFDLDTGDLLDSIYLGSTSRCKFSYIQWDTFRTTVTIGSTEKTSKNGNHASSYIALLSIYPLKFIALFKVDSEGFPGQKSPNLFDGLLTTRGKCSFPDKLINIFSRDHILHPNNILFNVNIDQTCPGTPQTCDECARSVDRIVGRGDHGLPVNVKVVEKPPILLSVRSSYESFEYGSWPIHIIYSPPRNSDTYVVESALNPIPLENGRFVYQNYIEDGQSMMFHPEEVDGRVIAADCHTLTFFRIINHTLSKRFVLSCTPLSYLKDLNRRLVTCKKAKKTDTNYKSLYGHANDDETGIYGLMGLDISTKSKEWPVICLFDNYTGKLLKKFKLDFKSEETNDYEIQIDRDIILINEFNLDNKGRFFYYQLTRKRPVE